MKLPFKSVGEFILNYPHKEYEERSSYIFIDNSEEKCYYLSHGDGHIAVEWSKFNKINNAGVSISGNDISDINKLFMINTFSVILITDKVFNNMKLNKFGRIINISSIGAKYGSSVESVAYGCSKLAIEGITKTYAKEGAEYNVLVNTIRPGIIDTNFHNKNKKDMGKRISMIPMKRMGTSEEVASIIYYLGSEQNTFITNETISIAGGE
jgi:3-oxoacyl-[acyl-carrier protein] reductase